MSYSSTKEQVVEYLKKATRSMNIDQLSGFTTINISKLLNLSRSLTSQYLNELVKDEKVIKISSRPVYYFDRMELEKKYHIEIKQFDFLNMSELLQTLQSGDTQLQDFQKAIGNEGSLHYCISQMKSALFYPDGGLPVLLYGEKGCGKSFLVNLIYEFCINHDLLSRQAPFIKMKIFRNDDMEYYKKELFGYFDKKENIVKKGKLEEASGGILFIQDIGNLNEDCQEKLAEYISTGKFTRSNDDSVMIDSSARIIFASMEDPRDILTQSLILNMPVICNIPSWISRNEDERKAFIIKFFKEEQERLDIPIYVSEKMLVLLMNYDFANNINELKKYIKTICANAYAENGGQERLDVFMYHLPIQLLDDIRVNKINQEDDNMIRIDAIEKNEGSNKIMMMWEQFLQVYEDNKTSFKKYLEEGQKIVRYYYDILIYQESYLDERLSAIEKIVLDILGAIKKSRNIILPINCGYVLTRMILTSQKNNSSFRQWEQDNRDVIKECLATMKQNMMNEYILSELILKQIQTHLDIRLSDMNRIFLMMNINLYNKDIHAQDTIGIILSHGYSTASSIADAANSLLSTYIFEAIDMPLDTPIQEVSKKLDAFISDNRHIKNIILLVDMGSLEEIGTMIADSVNVGVINNISTSLALNIGTKILQHYELEDILQIACEEAQCRYKVLSVAKKEKAIVFTNDAGLVVSEKLSRLFKDSLPKDIDLKMIEYDYDELLKNGSEDMLFKKYDVVLMIKPYNLKIQNVSSVTLEEIMNFKDIDKVNHVLLPYLDESEIEEFDQCLLKNFSMQSVMENLTILNAPKLLDYVSDAISALQHIMKQKFQSKTIVGIYIHICFLVERLVTKTALDKYKNLNGFIERHQDFIENVNRSFDTMLTHYNVKLPISEIAYLYEYIEHDNIKGGGEDEF